MIRQAPRPIAGNRRHRQQVRGQNLLDVKARAVTARRQRRKKLATFFWNSALVASVCAAAWFGVSTALQKCFFSNSSYDLKRVDMELDGVITREEALRETGISEGENIFRIDLAKAEQALRAIPQVADVCVERHLPDRISISITARDPVAWVASQEKDADPFDPEKSLLVDATGFLMKPRMVQPQYYRLPVIYGVSREGIGEGDSLKSDDLHRALALLDEVGKHPEYLLGIRTMNISKGYCIDVVSDSNARVVFSTEDFPEQLARLRKLLEHCRETGRDLESVNLMVRRNTPVTFAMAPPVTEKITAASQRSTQTQGGKKN